VPFAVIPKTLVNSASDAIGFLRSAGAALVAA
jgi:hypothetical protein